MTSKNTDNNRNSHILGGYDGNSKVVLKVKWNLNDFNELKALCMRAIGQKASLKFRGQRFNVNEDAMLKNCDPKNPHNIHLKSKDTSFIISPAQDPQSEYFHIDITYGSLSLLYESIFDLHKSNLGILADMGIIVEEEKLSRIDMQITIKENCRNIVKRIRRVLYKKKIFKKPPRILEQNSITVYFNSSTGKNLKIYDKAEEIRQSKNIEHYREILGREILDEGTSLTRIEFSLKSAFFKKKNLMTMDDLKQHEALIAKNLTDDFVLFTKKHNICPVWKKVQKEFQYYFPGQDGVVEYPTLPKKNTIILSETSRKRVLGTLASYLKVFCSRAPSLERCKNELNSFFKSNKAIIAKLMLKEIVKDNTQNLENQDIRVCIYNGPEYDSRGFKNKYDDSYVVESSCNKPIPEASLSSNIDEFFEDILDQTGLDKLLERKKPAVYESID